VTSASIAAAAQTIRMLSTKMFSSAIVVADPPAA
jgi:hypothetical protein